MLRVKDIKSSIMLLKLQLFSVLDFFLLKLIQFKSPDLPFWDDQKIDSIDTGKGNT
jgi:hypothetical protein